LTGLKDIGFFDEVDVPRKSSLLDSMADFLGEKLKYQPGERDMIVMQHKFKIIKADGTNVWDCLQGNWLYLHSLLLSLW
jgi:saccharopine dehydrogenase (NADP+, L-glutamate forming)